MVDITAYSVSMSQKNDPINWQLIFAKRSYWKHIFLYLYVRHKTTATARSATAVASILRKPVVTNPQQHLLACSSSKTAIYD